MKSLLKIWPILLISIIAAYFFVDRQLCQFVYDAALPQHLILLLQRFLGWIPGIDNNTLPTSRGLISYIVDWPPLLTGLSPFLLLLAAALRPGRGRDLLILMSLSLLFTFVMKNDLKWIFSRNWPMTWINNNPSWIRDHVYGFQWFQGNIFQGNDATGSFPSGHTAVAFATFLPIGLLYRKTLPYCIALASAEGFSMILFDYHFFSDVVAGALVGITCTLVVRTLLRSSPTVKNANAYGSVMPD